MRKINLQMDGNQICATWDNFDCLTIAPAGLGDNLWGALVNLIKKTSAEQINSIITSIENAPQNNIRIRVCGLCAPAKCARAQIYHDVLFAESKECEKCQYRTFATIATSGKTVSSK